MAETSACSASQLSFGVCYIQACNTKNQLENCRDVGAVATQPYDSSFSRAPAPIPVPPNTCKQWRDAPSSSQGRRATDTAASLWGKSCLAHRPSLHLERVLSSPGSSAVEGKGMEKRKRFTRMAAVVEPCPSMHRSSSRQPFSGVKYFRQIVAYVCHF